MKFNRERARMTLLQFGWTQNADRRWCHEGETKRGYPLHYVVRVYFPELMYGR